MSKYGDDHGRRVWDAAEEALTQDPPALCDLTDDYAWDLIETTADDLAYQDAIAETEASLMPGRV